MDPASLAFEVDRLFETESVVVCGASRGTIKWRKQVNVGELLLHKGYAVYSVESTQSAGDVVSILAKSAIGAVAVVDDGAHIEGIISERDILKALDASGVDVLDKKAKDLMSSDVVTCDSETTVGDVVTMMNEFGVRHMPVVTDDKLEGMLSMRDLVEIRIVDLEREVDELKK
jgi:CBS domain-containing protein